MSTTPIITKIAPRIRGTDNRCIGTLIKPNWSINTDATIWPARTKATVVPAPILGIRIMVAST